MSVPLTSNVVILQSALAELSETLLQSGVDPLLKVTLPVGELPLTTAVMENGWLAPPTNVVMQVVDKVVVVLDALFTTWLTAGDVDAALLLSPLYVAVTEWFAAESVLMLQVALVPLRLIVLHNVVAPSLNVTVLVGDWPVTVAVNVTL